MNSTPGIFFQKNTCVLKLHHRYHSSLFFINRNAGLFTQSVNYTYI